MCVVCHVCVVCQADNLHIDLTRLSTSKTTNPKQAYAKHTSNEQTHLLNTRPLIQPSVFPCPQA